MKLPPRSTALTPHLIVRDVEKAAQFYERGLGFQPKLMLPGGPQKTIRHAEVEYEGCGVMLGPESPERGIFAPVTSGKTPPVSLYLYVESVDAAHKKALEAGALELIAPSNQFFGARTSVVADPDGHQWMLSEHQKDMSEKDMRAAMAKTDSKKSKAHSAAAQLSGGSRRRPTIKKSP